MSLQSIEAEIDIYNQITLSKKIINQLLIEIKKDYEKTYRLGNDFVYLVDKEKGSQLSIQPSKISIIERKNLAEKDLKKSLDTIMNIIERREVFEKLPVKVSVEFNLEYKNGTTLENLQKFNSILNKESLDEPFVLTGINFVTGQNNTVYYVSIKIKTEGYEIEVESERIDYSLLETEIEHIKNSLTVKIGNLIGNLFNRVSVD